MTSKIIREISKQFNIPLDECEEKFKAFCGNIKPISQETIALKEKAMSELKSKRKRGKYDN